MPDDEIDDFESLRSTVEDILSRLNTVEDKVMMERLEDLALEDEIEVVEELVGESREDLKRKIDMIAEIEKQYQDNRIEEKLHFLYARLKELEEQLGTGETTAWEEQAAALEDRIDTLAAQLSTQQSEKKGRDLDDVYDKLYQLRDKVKEMQTSSGEGPDPTAVEDMESRLRNDLNETLSDMKTEHETLAERLEQVKQQATERSGGAGEDVREEMAELKQQVEENAATINESLEQHDEDIEKLKKVLQTASGEIDEDVADDLQSNITALKAQMREIEERLSAEQAVEDIVRDTIQNIDTINTLQDAVAELQEKMGDVDTAAGGADESQIAELRNQIDTHQQQIEALLERQEKLEGDVSVVDAEEDALNAKIAEEEQELQRKMQLLLEALEEGLELEAERADRGITAVKEALGEDLSEEMERIDALQRNMNHMEAEEKSQEAHEQVRSLAQVVQTNKKTLRRLEQRISDLTARVKEQNSRTATIIE